MLFGVRAFALLNSGLSALRLADLEVKILCMFANTFWAFVLSKAEFESLRAIRNRFGLSISHLGALLIGSGVPRKCL